MVQIGRSTLIRPYPISLEWPSRWAQSTPPVLECRASVLHELGLPSHALLGLGIDRLDYTKGVAERLLAVERLLERSPERNLLAFEVADCGKAHGLVMLHDQEAKAKIWRNGLSRTHPNAF